MQNNPMETPEIVKNDPWLGPFEGVIRDRLSRAMQKENEFIEESGSLRDFAAGHLYFGLHRLEKSWVFREWAPNASRIFLIGDFNDWELDNDYLMKQTPDGNRFWITLSGLESGKEYIFQYLIDGDIRIADPYTEKWPSD